MGGLWGVMQEGGQGQLNTQH